VFDDPRAGSAAELSVEDNVALAMRRGRHRRLRRAVTADRHVTMRRVLSALGLGLEDRLGDPVGLLSAGQRQALTLAMAAFGTPRVLLLDERLSALDPNTTTRLRELTIALADRLDAVTLMITHDVHDALTLGDRLLVLRAGQLAHDRSATCEASG
jgi:putative ABC transport system ATP-binding protein